MKEALETFAPLRKSAEAGSPEWMRLTTLMGLAHYGRGEYADAVPYLKEAITGDPQNLPFRLTLAHSCLWSKQYQCVLDVYREILTLNSESAEADMLAGEALDEMNDDLGAIQRFRAAAKEDPKMPDVHFGLGYLLWRQNHYDEAAKEFQAEIDNVPENAQAMAYLADSYMHLNKTEDAHPLLEKAIQLDPKLERAHLDLGAFYSDAGRQEEAERELEEAAKLTPDDPEVHWRLARVYQALGKKDEARAESQKTSNLKKAANDTIFSKLKAAQEKGASGQGTPSTHP
jgi:tetratricopeptide (TPR) repeat protein